MEAENGTGQDQLGRKFYLYEKPHEQEAWEKMWMWLVGLFPLSMVLNILEANHIVSSCYAHCSLNAIFGLVSTQIRWRKLSFMWCYEQLNRASLNREKGRSWPVQFFCFTVSQTEISGWICRLRVESWVSIQKHRICFSLNHGRCSIQQTSVNPLWIKVPALILKNCLPLFLYLYTWMLNETL